MAKEEEEEEEEVEEEGVNKAIPVTGCNLSHKLLLRDCDPLGRTARPMG